MGSTTSAYTNRSNTLKHCHNTEEDDDLLDGKDREEDIAQFPYVEFTGRDSITCPSCQGTGCIPTEHVNELVALIPYSDQRLQPQRTSLQIRNSNFYAISVDSLTSQVQYMNTVIGTQQKTNVSFIQPLSEKLVNFTVKAQLGGTLSYL
ncbi:hypothetical protein FKM82_009413 [Ascaphus truei]